MSFLNFLSEVGSTVLESVKSINGVNLKLERIFTCDTYTIGKLYVNGTYFCDTLEDADRGLDDSMSLSEIKKKKVYGKTAIPTGTYDITLDVTSPKFSKYDFYMKVCNGKVPRLLNVKGYEGILIHVADGYKGADLVLGCIGIGKNTIKGGLTDGKNVFTKLYEKLKSYNTKNIKIEIYAKYRK